MATWCNEGKSSLGNVYLTGGTNPDKCIGLYTNSTEPSTTSSIASLGEPTASGYARIQIENANWTEATENAGLFTNTTITFSATSSWGNVYGYFIATVQTETAGLLLAFENFGDGPYSMTNNWNIKIVPSINFE